jgi:glycosyltransferase involved in cell wall biosynthesis
MRVLQVTPRYFPNMGGIEIVVQKISETLVERGIESVVYSVDRSCNLAPVENIHGVLVKRFAPWFADPLYLPEPEFVSSLRKENTDVIHVHNIHTLPPLIVALSRRSDQKMLLQPHYHRYGQSPFRHAMLELYLKNACDLIFSRTHVIVANSAYEKRVFCEDFPEARNVVVVPEGIDVDEVRLVKREPVEPKRILYVGVLRRYKNVDKILEGFACLMENGQRNFRLVVVGDGPERDSLFNQARGLGISEFVEWKRGLTRQQLLGEYAKASVFILLSPLESFSRVVYDALFIGVPVVILDFGVFRRLVEAGFVEGVRSLTPVGIADAILKATAKTYPRISLDADSFLDWKSYSDRIIETYQKLSEI